MKKTEKFNVTLISRNLSLLHRRNFTLHFVTVIHEYRLMGRKSSGFFSPIAVIARIGTQFPFGSTSLQRILGFVNQSDLGLANGRRRKVVLVVKVEIVVIVVFGNTVRNVRVLIFVYVQKRVQLNTW